MLSKVLERPWLARSLATLVLRRRRATRGADPERDDYLLLSSAMNAVLSGCSADCAKRHYAASLKVYRTLLLQLTLQRQLRLCPYLLSDALHEIAGHVERPVRDAALRCLLRVRAAT